MNQYFLINRSQLGDIAMEPCEPGTPGALPGMILETEAGHTIRAAALSQQYDYAKKRATIAIYAEMKPSGDDGFIQLPRTGNRPRWRSGAPIVVEESGGVVGEMALFARLHHIFQE